MKEKKKVFSSWSGGKDCSLACYKAMKGLLVVFSVLLVLISFWTICGGSEITKWNSVTENDSGTFSVNISIDESEEVEFRVSSGLIYDWTWSVNGEDLKESEGKSSDLSYVFTEYGTYNVSVVGERENETTECAYWNVTVSLAIGEENDVRELEGLEDYTLRISKRPERIISMAPSCTEILFAVGAGDSVVGVTSFCDYPLEVGDKVNKGEIEVIGGYSTPSFEKIVDLEPDLIVSAYGNPDDVIYRVVEFGYPVYAQNPKNIEEIFAHIKVTGAITNCNENASSLLDELRERLEEIEEKTELLEEEQRPRVFYNIGGFFTAGKDTFINAIIETAGGKNIAADKSGYFIMNLEELIDKNPQVILCDSGMGSISTAYEEIMSDGRLKIVDAVKNSRVYLIEGDIMDRPGPRVIDAVEIVQVDYSEFFEEYEKEEKEEEEEEEEEESGEVTSGSPNITAWNPIEAIVNNTESESRAFNMTVNQTVDISWRINGTEVQTNESITEASFTKSAVIGTWNVSAIATNTTIDLSDMHIWIWNVKPTPTATPTPSVNITATPSPTPSPISTPTSTLVITPTSTPTPEEKQKSREEEIPEPPGFEMFFAVIGLLAVMYLLRRKAV